MRPQRRRDRQGVRRRRFFGWTHIPQGNRAELLKSLPVERLYFFHAIVSHDEFLS
jgi:hypothetical protein